MVQITELDDDETVSVTLGSGGRLRGARVRQGSGAAAQQQGAELSRPAVAGVDVAAPVGLKEGQKAPGVLSETPAPAQSRSEPTTVKKFAAIVSAESAARNQQSLADEAVERLSKEIDSLTARGASRSCAPARVMSSN